MYFLLLKTQLRLKDGYTIYIFLKHRFTRDNAFALMSSCGNEVYKVEKSNKDT